MEETIRSLALAQGAPTGRHLCPSCSAERKNKHDKCLSVTVEGDLIKYQCWHCSYSGAMRLTERRSLIVTPPKMLDLSPPKEDELEHAYSWLATRGITRGTAIKAGIIGGVKFIDGQSVRAVGFPYRKGAETYAIKWRAVGSKAFTQTGSAISLWCSDQIKKGDPLTICEGELDCLALRQTGINAVSVPNGAPQKISNKSDPSGSVRFGYLGQGEVSISEAPKIIIAVDADEPGTVLGEELARRIGRARCWKATWPDGCKDANDVLRLHGSEVLRDCITNAQPWPVKGLYDAEHFHDKVVSLYDRGLPKGESTGFKCVDEIYSIVPGQLTVVTGSPGSGKSTMIDNILVSLAKRLGWKFAICSFENPPEVHIAKLAAAVVRRPFFDGPTPRMDKALRDRALSFVREHFVFLHQADGSLSSIDDIIDLTRSAILRYGVRGLVVDPYNFLDRGKDSSETDWVSDALTKLKVLSMGHDLHTWIMAHPTKMRRKEDGSFPVPTGYDISGSAHWFNKADMGLTVHRPDMLDNKTEVHMWKVRFSFQGKIGSCSMAYDPPTGLYFEKVTGE